MIREKLEALSDDLLIEYAATLGVDIPEGLERIFMIESILEAVAEEQEERDELAAESPEEKKYAYPFVEIAPPGANDILLEGSYNETKIVLMLRDPYWAYTYWEIKEAEKKPLMVDPSFEELFLHVVQIDGIGPAQGREYFDIPVSFNDDRWYINLPDQNRTYYIELIAHVHDADHILARSETIRTPQSLLLIGSEAGASRKLFELSGLYAMAESGLIPSNASVLSRTR